MKVFIGILIGVAALIIGLSFYLTPNDFRACDIATGPTLNTACQKADAIIAVSGGDTNARATEAIGMYQKGWASKLIFSGAAKDKTGPSNAAAMRTLALQSGVPDTNIIVEEYGQTTRQNAEKTQAILRENGISSVILVTSAYHQRRAELEFKKRSEGTVVIRNYPVASDSQWSSWWWLTPRGWWLAGGEIVKIIAFYMGDTT